MEFLGQGLYLRHSCDLSRSHGNAGSLSHCAGLGIEPVPQCSLDATDSVAPQWALQRSHFGKMLTYQLDDRTARKSFSLLEALGQPQRRHLTLCPKVSFYFKKLFIIFCFLGPHLWHMKVPRPGVESELQLPAYTTVTATQDLSCICDLHHSSW